MRFQMRTSPPQAKENTEKGATTGTQTNCLTPPTKNQRVTNQNQTTCLKVKPVGPFCRPFKARGTKVNQRGTVAANSAFCPGLPRNGSDVTSASTSSRKRKLDFSKTLYMVSSC